MNRFFTLFVLAVIPVLAGFRSEAGSEPIAILAALDSEVSALKKELELVGRSFEFGGRIIYQARFAGHPLLLTKTGAAPEAARAIAEWLVQEKKVRAVISIGPAGALSDEFEIGDVVAAASSLDDFASAEPHPLMKVRDCRLKSAGVIVSVDRFLANASERARLRSLFNADLVDMSSASIVAALGEGGKIVIIREITDRADEDAPRAFAAVVRSKQPRTIPATLCAIRRLIEE